MSRRTLSDRQWDRIKELIRGKQTDRGVTGRDNRLFVDAVLWIARTGAPWRNLPPELGHWNNTWRLFARWVRVGVWESFFKVLADDPDFEYVIVDSTIVRAHQHAAGAKGGLRLRRSGLARGLEHQAPYLRGRAGQSVARAPHPGPQARDDRGRALIEGLLTEIVIAGSAFDAGAFRDHLAGRAIAAVIAANPTNAFCPALDRHLYKERHLVECFINKIKHSRRIATRYIKTTLTYFSMICIACLMLWLK